MEISSIQEFPFFQKGNFQVGKELEEEETREERVIWRMEEEYVEYIFER